LADLPTESVSPESLHVEQYKTEPACLHCDGWGCSRCLPRRGEQGPSDGELREERLKARVRELEALLNMPETVDFIEGVRREAAHQRERWGSEHDDGKTDADWFWLVGYLVGKALHKPEKRLHHLITAAAALLNWHLYTLGKTNMRPGIEPPTRGAR
jgi:hypothetical protein